MASGGLTGLGFGKSRQKFAYLPEEQNDYIFSIICEEMGFIGAAHHHHPLRPADHSGLLAGAPCPRSVRRTAIVGITTLLAVQVFLNMAVVANLIPSTGIALPFFSYGGTALVIQLAEIGHCAEYLATDPRPAGAGEKAAERRGEKALKKAKKAEAKAAKAAEKAE